MRKILAYFFCLLSAGSSLAQDPATQIFYMTENYPPGNYLEHDSLTGASVAILKAVWRKMEVPEQTIHVLPWPRAYSDAQLKPGTMLFTMTYTPTRAPIFRWVGPIFSANIVLIGLRSRHPKIDSVQEARKYLTGVIRDDISQISLIAKGFLPAEMATANHFSQTLQMLLAGRVQFVCLSEDGLYELFKLHQIKTEDIDIVAIVDRQDKYFAFHKSTSEELIQRFQNALEGIRREHDAILKQYNLHR